MLVYEEYLAPARPSEVLAALRGVAVSRSWVVADDHSSWFFCLEEGKSVRQEPRRIAVLVEDYRLETKVRFVVWCSGFTIRRFDGKVDLIPALPYECTLLSKGVPASQPSPTGSTDTGRRRPSWVDWTRFGEYALISLSFAGIALVAVAIARHLPLWSAAIGLAVAAVAPVSAGLVLDLSARRALKISSRRGIGAQFRRAALSAGIAVILLVWLLKM